MLTLRRLVLCILLLAVHMHRAARVLVMTDEKFRKKMQFVLDTRVQAGAYAGMVLQMLIVPGTTPSNM
jgi:type IV secretory pathway VirB3-like protein